MGSSFDFDTDRKKSFRKKTYLYCVHLSTWPGTYRERKVILRKKTKRRKLTIDEERTTSMIVRRWRVADDGQAVEEGQLRIVAVFFDENLQRMEALELVAYERDLLVLDHVLLDDLNEERKRQNNSRLYIQIWDPTPHTTLVPRKRSHRTWFENDDPGERFTI